MNIYIPATMLTKQANDEAVRKIVNKYYYTDLVLESDEHRDLACKKELEALGELEIAKNLNMLVTQ